MPVPSAVAPSRKVTVPVGILEPLPVTVAIRVSCEPAEDGLRFEVRVVVVAAF